MGAYNFSQIGCLPLAQCNESSFLLNQVLKTEWGFKGFVMSDYLAIHDGVKAYLGGCDLELPASKLMSSPTVGALILNGTLPESILDDKVRQNLREVVSLASWIVNSWIPLFRVLTTSNRYSVNGISVEYSEFRNILSRGSELAPCLRFFGKNSEY